MESLINLLMARDGITQDEAESLLGEVCFLMAGQMNNGDVADVEAVFTEKLSIEPDEIMVLMPIVENVAKVLRGRDQ